METFEEAYARDQALWGAQKTQSATAPDATAPAQSPDSNYVGPITKGVQGVVQGGRQIANALVPPPGDQSDPIARLMHGLGGGLNIGAAMTGLTSLAQTVKNVVESTGGTGQVPEPVKKLAGTLETILQEGPEYMLRRAQAGSKGSAAVDKAFFDKLEANQGRDRTWADLAGDMSQFEAMAAMHAFGKGGGEETQAQPGPQTPAPAPGPSPVSPDALDWAYIEEQAKKPGAKPAATQPPVEAPPQAQEPTGAPGQAPIETPLQKAAREAVESAQKPPEEGPATGEGEMAPMPPPPPLTPGLAPGEPPRLNAEPPAAPELAQPPAPGEPLQHLAQMQEIGRSLASEVPTGHTRLFRGGKPEGEFWTSDEAYARMYQEGKPGEPMLQRDIPTNKLAEFQSEVPGQVTPNRVAPSTEYRFPGGIEEHFGQAPDPARIGRVMAGAVLGADSDPGIAALKALAKEGIKPSVARPMVAKYMQALNDAGLVECE